MRGLRPGKMPGAATYAAVFVLGLFQLTTAGHDAQHVFGDIAETCVVCVHLDQPNAMPSKATRPAGQAAPITPLVTAAASPRGLRLEHLPLSRAPPHV